MVFGVSAVVVAISNEQNLRPGGCVRDFSTKPKRPICAACGVVGQLNKEKVCLPSCSNLPGATRVKVKNIARAEEPENVYLPRGQRLRSQLINGKFPTLVFCSPGHSTTKAKTIQINVVPLVIQNGLQWTPRTRRIGIAIYHNLWFELLNAFCLVADNMSVKQQRAGQIHSRAFEALCSDLHGWQGTRGLSRAKVIKPRPKHTRTCCGDFTFVTVSP